MTEAEAVRLGLAQDDVAASLQARRGIAAGNAAAAGRWDNPEIEFSEENVDLDGGSSEERDFWIRQRLNIAGVHGLRRDAAARQQQAQNVRTAFSEHEIAAEIRLHFYEALAADAETKVIEGWHSRLAELSRAVSSRVAAGDASRYDQSRLEGELAMLRGELLTAAARAESAHDHLFSRIGSEATSIKGDLLPPSADRTRGSGVVDDHPLLRAMDIEAAGERISARAESRRKWPELTLGFGRRWVSEPGFNTNGHLVMVGLEIPIFDRGTGKAQAHESRAQQLTAERALSEARLASDLRAIQRTLEARRQAALALRNFDVAASDSLASIAESAYSAGEIGVMELIDAHRTELAARREFVSRSLAARQAFIELQLQTGQLQ
ncbi:MAG: TolC family protein [Wenzhouxiangellaceae bacterium]|nr:TolC family protein [Wenzhouxiangellaceae bacterium]